jgi:hypothetical protein
MSHRPEKGERGPPGNPGLSGATIRDWKIDRARYVATPMMSDGREGPPLNCAGYSSNFCSRQDSSDIRSM